MKKLALATIIAAVIGCAFTAKAKEFVTEEDCRSEYQIAFNVMKARQAGMSPFEIYDAIYGVVEKMTPYRSFYESYMARSHLKKVIKEAFEDPLKQKQKDKESENKAFAERNYFKCLEKNHLIETE